MQARLTQLNYQEILMYLGHRGQECPMELEQQIHRCMEEVTKAAEPRHKPDKNKKEARQKVPRRL